MEDICLVYVTAANKVEAEEIATAVLSNRLAACANIIENIQSMFWWEGKIQKDKEALLILKTKKILRDELEKAIKSNHSYTNPCILFIPIQYASGDFKEWIIRETV